MSTIFVGEQNTARRLEAYRQMTDISCGSASLHICYKALGLLQTEVQIRSELQKKRRALFSWADMLDHPRRLGLISNLYFNATYENLMGLFYDDLSVLVVGWLPDGDNRERIFHFSPVKGITPEEIRLIDTCKGREMRVYRDTFMPRWRDYEHTRAFMTIARE